jgi:diphthine-ammonia ligase
MTEPFLDQVGSLIPEAEWTAFVESLEHLQIDSERNEEQILQKLEELLIEAVKKRILEDGKLGVLFSGGIDSTLIAFILKKLDIEFVCISVGFHDGEAKIPEDIVESKRIANELGFEQERIMLNLDEMERVFKKTAQILKESGEELVTVVNLGVGAVEVAAIEHGKKHGITHFLGGLGSEEIFAGYDRHEKALEQGGNDALHNECLAGLKKMYQRDLRRDTLIPQALGVTAATPFLDTALVRFALSIPPELKINSEKTFTGKLQGDVDGEKRYKKLILRQTAEKMGLPRDIAFRPKRAAQYGSRTNNALTALRKTSWLQR